jgi:P-type Ca2+ transporter type 2C
MMIERVVTGSGEVAVTGTGYRPVGALQIDGRPLDNLVLLDEVRLVLGGGSLANNAVLRDDGSDNWTIQGDPTDASFLVAEAKIGSPKPENRALSASAKFRSRRKASS